ncbi:MAG: glutathione S-transferase family protein [Hyphomonas sp.]|nr:glutathione S-transferase family protein [Hyphomonas sp.]
MSEGRNSMGRTLIHSGEPLSEGNLHGLILYDAASSPCARRVRIALLEKELDWDTVSVNLGGLEQRSADFLALNPNGVVPVLAHGERVIFESGVINEYLDVAFPSHPLFPSDARLRARVRMWQAMELEMAKTFRPLMYQRVLGPLTHISRTLDEALAIARKSSVDPFDIEWASRVWSMTVLSPEEERHVEMVLLDWLGHVERALTDSRFLVGDSFTYADLAVFPRVEMYANGGLSIEPSQFPETVRWMLEVSQRPSVISSLPEEAAKSAELARSPFLAKIRKHLATPVAYRDDAFSEELQQFAAGMREKQKIDAQLAGEISPRKLPQPTLGPIAPESKLESPAVGLPAKTLVLFGADGSPHTKRIVDLMTLLGLEFEYQSVDLARNENMTPRIRAISPLGKLPVLVADGMAIFDSGTIADFLLSQAPNSIRPAPRSDVRIAEERMWLAHEAGIHKEVAIVLGDHKDPDGNVHKPPLAVRQVEFASARLRTAFEKVSAALNDRSFLMGAAISFVDLAWSSRLENLRSTAIGEQLLTLKNIPEWQERVAREVDSRTSVPG